MLVPEDDVKLMTPMDLVTLLLMRELILLPMEKDYASGLEFIPIFQRQTVLDTI
jgi:hypothetical protein